TGGAVSWRPVHPGEDPPRWWCRRASLGTAATEPLVQVPAQRIDVLRTIETPSLPAAGTPAEGLQAGLWRFLAEGAPDGPADKLGPRCPGLRRGAVKEP